MKPAEFVHLRLPYYFVFNSFETFHGVYLEYECAGPLKSGELLSRSHSTPSDPSLHFGPIAARPQLFDCLRTGLRPVSQ